MGKGKIIMVKGHNKKIDKKYRAKLPGRRVSKFGNVYYEWRINRVDKNPNSRY